MITLKIGELDMHCGECSIIDYCDKPFSDIAICCEERFKNIGEKQFLFLAESSKKSNKKELIDDVYRRINTSN